MASRRALHFVYKIGDREATAKFYREILGMKVLRHEEFEKGCEATCNGPYDGKWSKTMIGYGPEDNHFVCELTYNYGISHYEMGNDFLGMYIESSEALERAKASDWPVKQDGEHSVLEAPGGYKFFIINKPQPGDRDPVQQVVLASSNLEKSIKYWRDLAGLTMYKKTDKAATFGYANTQAKVILQDIGGPVDHAKAFGRVAFAAPGDELLGIEKTMKKANQTIVKPFISLETPGKAMVEVVILADPDDHEICFVGVEGFTELSQVDPKADDLLNEAMEKDKSDEWFAKKGGKALA
ncbi:glyoxalase domain-containing protein 4-like [Homarus americanus]|uniref:Glyoxalase domain-containing protein 4-like n=1 Tax=Homarus americanus TaxID=6706 RepID=A0A8J5JNI4_HOMAM|nr:glyoxalase domain-containing protein 4-like [Homarus americanus]KAG7159446.1 Glyoxalase domain-containing protein 4-like [Homarus americanus]